LKNLKTPFSHEKAGSGRSFICFLSFKTAREFIFDIAQVFSICELPFILPFIEEKI